MKSGGSGVGKVEGRRKEDVERWKWKIRKREVSFRDPSNHA
jgi:hypothetical protein